jgi:hypothetical protein
LAVAISLAVGLTVSTVKLCAALMPVLPSVSVWLACAV